MENQKVFTLACHNLENNVVVISYFRTCTICETPDKMKQRFINREIHKGTIQANDKYRVLLLEGILNSDKVFKAFSDSNLPINVYRKII